MLGTDNGRQCKQQEVRLAQLPMHFTFWALSVRPDPTNESKRKWKPFAQSAHTMV
jgi:hypothetical protein